MTSFKILTLFPEYFDVLKSGILGKAIEKKLFSVEVENIRDYSTDKHKKTDDYPFGGGAGMVMTPQPIHDAILAVDALHEYTRINVSPRGVPLTQALVKELSQKENLLFLCGSYEGIDQRVIDMDIDMEISIGDYVLTSGELPALVILNAITRYIPDVLEASSRLRKKAFPQIFWNIRNTHVHKAF